ncbi:hypothetical protein LCGC14_1369450 [marine sediment metagenome]|uniref:DNA methylase N-4/N-6 domain-containing protein n=1 Tax=marine sediment metagenome TaxID=412755 RepID=A0A0F9KRP8_9ZZZZ
MKISRCWSMPSRWTFTIKPIAELLARYVGDGKDWIDPFAGENSPAEFTNDLNEHVKAGHHKDALLWLKELRGLHIGALFDPPYSITQAKECYEGYGMNLLDIKPTSMEYWAGVKTEMARLIRVNGIVICCGWTSQGLGMTRGFKMIEILLVPHGGSKNDTTVTVERKVQSQLKVESE